jgi:YD repeat-containing protein
LWIGASRAPAISGGSFGFGYDVLSRKTNLTRPNSVNTSYSYDNLSHLLNVTHAKGGVTLDAVPGLPTNV